MPARIIEELASRKKEKIATFLTFESIVAVMIGFMPLFMISSSWPLLVRVPVCLVGAVAGYILTLEVHGLALYEQILWMSRGLVRLRTQGDLRSPAELPGALVEDSTDQIIEVSGAFEVISVGPGQLPLQALLSHVTAPPSVISSSVEESTAERDAACVSANHAPQTIVYPEAR